MRSETCCGRLVRRIYGVVAVESRWNGAIGSVGWVTLGKLQIGQSVTGKKGALRICSVIEPWNVSSTAVLNLGYRWELQLFGIEEVMVSDDLFGGESIGGGSRVE